VEKIKKNKMRYHKPVLLHESVHGLKIDPKGVYVDATFGGGGHSKLILKKLKKGKLFAFDHDQDTKKNSLKEDGFKLTQANFRYIKNFLKLEGVTQIDGLLADLGVSSYQFDVAQRGFSIRYDSELDMRMNKNISVSAKDILNKYDIELLANMFYQYGELKNSRKIADYIHRAREINPICTTNQLIDIISNLVPIKRRNQFLARVFQAIRIEVNDEINALEEMLIDAISMLKKGGRIVVISYHSLEDRLVKNLFNKGNFIGKIEKDFFGNKLSPLIPINKNVITPNNVEISNNSRSRSAKLRIAEKI